MHELVIERGVLGLLGLLFKRAGADLGVGSRECRVLSGDPELEVDVEEQRAEDV